MYTPEGLAEKACVHQVPAGGKIAQNGDIITRSGAVQHVAKCTQPTLAYPASGQPAAARPAHAGGVTSASSCKAANKQWWAETCAFDTPGLVYLNERYSIPSNPQKSGALIFFFPSFENQSGSSIVQPVLTWGANGGVTNPDIWYITSWYGDNGTYYTSGSAHVQPGGTVTGEIQRGLCALPTSACEYIIHTTVGSASVSLTWFSGPEMNQVEGGVMEVPRATGCVETPASGHEAFRNLTVHDVTGTVFPPLTGYTINSQCSVRATASGTNTDITWAP